MLAHLGQPIFACANGKVILAHKNFRLHGNVVAIDHGQGVISIYIHMQKINVKEGDMVSAGEQIGNVGATGRANGPHLHLSLYVNKIATNPMPWFSKVFKYSQLCNSGGKFLATLVWLIFLCYHMK